MELHLGIGRRHEIVRPCRQKTEDVLLCELVADHEDRRTRVLNANARQKIERTFHALRIDQDYEHIG
jgi:hypothetical protein